jgi:uncharacterized protein YneF (UPF0154 family)
MSSLALIIGSVMVVIGLALGAYITVQILQQRKADNDESFD